MAKSFTFRVNMKHTPNNDQKAKSVTLAPPKSEKNSQRKNSTKRVV